MTYSGEMLHGVEVTVIITSANLCSCRPISRGFTVAKGRIWVFSTDFRCLSCKGLYRLVYTSLQVVMMPRVCSWPDNRRNAARNSDMIGFNAATEISIRKQLAAVTCGPGGLIVNTDKYDKRCTSTGEM